MFVVFFIALAGISFQQLDKSERFRLADETIERLDVYTLYLFKTDVDFYNYDLITPAFYTAEHTPLLRRHDSLLVYIDSLMIQIRAVEDFELENHLSRIDSLVGRYDQKFKALALALRSKGFKDFGLEGTLRKFAHALEDKKLISEKYIQEFCFCSRVCHYFLWNTYLYYGAFPLKGQVIYTTLQTFSLIDEQLHQVRC